MSFHQRKVGRWKSAFNSVHLWMLYVDALGGCARAPEAPLIMDVIDVQDALGGCASTLEASLTMDVIHVQDALGGCVRTPEASLTMDVTDMSRSPGTST